MCFCLAIAYLCIIFFVNELPFGTGVVFCLGGGLLSWHFSWLSRRSVMNLLSWLLFIKILHALRLIFDFLKNKCIIFAFIWWSSVTVLCITSCDCFDYCKPSRIFDCFSVPIAFQ